jgi:hypothetical protein
MKNKKNLIIILIVLVAIVGIVLFLKYKKYDVTFVLNGKDKITIEYGETFIDPGFVAKNGFGKDLSENVKVTGIVNSFISDDYEIVYELTYDDVTENITRIVTVNKVDINKLNIVLNGEETVYLLKDTEYKEEGAYVFNNISNEKFELGTLTISDDINVSKTGLYNVTYTYNYDGKTINKTRKVEVFDIITKLSTEELTTGKVKIMLDLSTISNYSNTKLPDGTTSLYKDIDYEVSKNGDYNFVITLKNNTKYEKIVNVDNIIGNYKCTGTITNTGTKICVTPSDGVERYEWVINNKISNGNSIYNEYKIIKKAKVNLVFKNGKSHQVNCNIEDKLLYHFTYNLEDTGNWVKPEMKCSTYTAADRTRLEKMLKDAIVEAGGKGTRGGIVAAARFLVGGLDYRVRYLGPKTTDSRLGRYSREGLNIGNGTAWGCRVSGYIQGMDCTHFIEWVLAQNGMSGSAYSFKKTDTSKVINNLKPGDLVYQKCGKSCANPSAGLSHVGMIVGIDRNKSIFYIAESVPGKDGKLGVTLHANKKETILKAYAYIGNISFKGEGYVTDMWLTE